MFGTCLTARHILRRCDFRSPAAYPNACVCLFGQSGISSVNLSGYLGTAQPHLLVRACTHAVGKEV